MIDIHHHLIHGVDDGAKNFEQTQKMIRKAVENGLSAIVTTPHAVPGQHFFDLPLYLDHLQMAQAWCDENGIDIGLYPGAEIFYTDHTLRMLDEGRIPTLNQTRFVLLEFGLKVSFEKLVSVAQELTEADYQPVYAHIERYPCLESAGHVRKLSEKYGVLMQMNANTVINPGGLMRRMRIRKLLQSGLIDVIASDAHNTDSRACHMAQAYEKLVQLCGQQKAQRLCINQPLKMMQDS